MRYFARTCPVCGEHDTTDGIASRVPGESQEWNEISQCWSGLFQDKVFFTYRRCASCGVLYCPEYFSEPQLGKLYASMDANMSDVPATQLERTQSGYFKEVAAHLPASGGYLELGPDVGYFTRLCARASNFNKFWLFEPNREVWPKLEAIFDGDTDVHLNADLAGTATVPEESISLAVAIHVLDHVLDPVSVLKTIRGKMSDNGIFMCVTHDEQSLLARVLGPRWPAYCLQHPQLYNGRSIRTLFKFAGFEVLAVRKSMNYFPLGFLARQGLWATLGTDIGQLKKLDRINIGLRLGNILTIAKPSGL